MNKRTLGADKEHLAALFLEKQGVEILEKNYRCRLGEIDLIGRDGAYLVFFEIKFRSGHEMGYPEEAVGTGKQKTICRVGDHFRLTRQIPSGQSIRYDVVAIEGEEIRWIKNAFPHHYRG